MRTPLLLLTLALTLASYTRSAAQIRIDTTRTIQQLVGEDLLGKRVKVRDIRYLGSPRARGAFHDPADQPLIANGILLTTGDVFNLNGPNRTPSTGTDLGRKGDRALQYIGRGPTFDAAMIEFDFMAAMDYVSFNFIFASEEYTEYVGSAFNDVFAFFITGPGITGQKNLAIVPGSGAPITVNSVNHIYNTHSYIDNDQFGKRGQLLKGKAETLDQYLFNTFEFDGMTTLLRAETAVQPGEVYHIRICIADVGDYQYDSAVLLEAHSFSSYPRDKEKRLAMMAEEQADWKRRMQPGIVGEKPNPLTASNPATDTIHGDSPSPLGEGRGGVSTPPGKLASIPGNPWRFEFGFDQHHLEARHRATLDTVAAYLKTHPKARLRIEGHTDAIGSSAYNLRLSRLRAQAVQAHLLQAGIPNTRTEVAFFGLDRPAAPNTTDQGRARNRRVEIIVLE